MPAKPRSQINHAICLVHTAQYTKESILELELRQRMLFPIAKSPLTREFMARSRGVGILREWVKKLHT